MTLPTDDELRRLFPADDPAQLRDLMARAVTVALAEARTGDTGRFCVSPIGDHWPDAALVHVASFNCRGCASAWAAAQRPGRALRVWDGKTGQRHVGPDFCEHQGGTSE